MSLAAPGGSSPAAKRAAGGRGKASTGYKLSLRSVRGLQLPESAVRAAESGGYDEPTLLHKLSAPLFDSQEKAFFGRTYELCFLSKLALKASSVCAGSRRIRRRSSCACWRLAEGCSPSKLADGVG